MNTPKPDISAPEDIRRFVDAFYERVRQDDPLRYLFDEVAGLDWPSHLPRMYDFWNALVFGTGEYKGNPMQPHLNLARLAPVRPEHFQRWLRLFEATIDAHFAGEVADQTKMRARSIATVIESKLFQTGLLADSLESA